MLTLRFVLTFDDPRNFKFFSTTNANISHKDIYIYTTITGNNSSNGIMRELMGLSMNEDSFIQDKIERSVLVKFKFPASMSFEDQDAILNDLKIVPYEGGVPKTISKEMSIDDDGMLHDQRRVIAYNEIDYSKKGFKHHEKALIISVKFPDWMPKEIVYQANRRILASAEEIVNGYLSRRFVSEKE